jgi:hypothetical protein
MTFQDTFRHLFLSGVISLQNTYFHVYFALKNEIRFSDLIVTAVWPLCEGGKTSIQFLLIKNMHFGKIVLNFKTKYVFLIKCEKLQLLHPEKKNT